MNKHDRRLRILELLTEQPMPMVELARTVLEASPDTTARQMGPDYKAIRRDVMRLVDKGVLRDEGSGADRTYHLVESEPEPAPPARRAAASRAVPVQLPEGDWQALNRIDYLQRHLAEVHEDIDKARRDGVWTAVANLRTRAHQLRDSLDAALIEAQGDSARTTPLEDESDADVIQILLETVRDLPEPILARVEEAIEARRTGRPMLSVVGEQP